MSIHEPVSWGVEVDLCLTAINPPHAQWLVKLYKFFTITEGSSIVIKGWKKAGFTDVLNGTTTVTEEDSFEEIFRD